MEKFCFFGLRIKTTNKVVSYFKFWRKFGKNSVPKGLKPNKKSPNGLVLPFYFGWQLRVIWERAQIETEKTFWIFKNYWHYIAVVCVLIAVAGIGIFFRDYQSALAATFSWTQTDWSGGQNDDYASHLSDKSEWIKFFGQDEGISAGEQLTLVPIEYAAVQTSDADYNGGIANQTEVKDTGTFGSVTLEELAKIETGITAGDSHSCFLSENGRIYCWGQNNYGQLGNALTSNSSTPVMVLGGAAADGDNDGTYLTNTKAATGGGNGFTCSVSNAGNTYCWGRNNYGQLGNGTVDDNHIPVRVSKGAAADGDNDGSHLTNIKEISGGGSYVCAVSTAGNIYCWGYNSYGQLGDNTTNDSSVPVRVLAGGADAGDTDGIYLTNIRSVEAGKNYACAISNGGNLYCWGYNSAGQLGNGLTDNSYLPVRVLVGAAAIEDTNGEYLANSATVAASSNYTCAASISGNIYCWGYNGNGQLGDGGTNQQTTPVRVLAGVAVEEDISGEYLANIIAVAASSNYTCAVSDGGNAYCWGYNYYGQLGDGTTSDSLTPARVLKGQAADGDASGDYLASIKAISFGIFDISNFTCALSESNNIYCWGLNNYGQLGDGTLSDRLTAVRVVGVGGEGYLGGAMPSYVSSGDFTSSAINVGLNLNFSDLGFNVIEPQSTEIKFQLRSGASEESLAAAIWYGPAGTDDYYTSGTTTINMVHGGDEWIQYKAFLSTSDPIETPVLSDISIGYAHYSALATLTSSPYNTTDGNNILDNIQWSESLAENTDIKFQLRTAPDNGGNPGVWSSWTGPDGTNLSYFTDAGGAEAIPGGFSDAIDDQWIQYKVWLVSDELHTPSLNDISLTYVVNTPPEFNPNYPSAEDGGAAASFVSPERVDMFYSVLDPDTDHGGEDNQYKIWPSFEYSLDDGQTWAQATSTFMGNTDMDPKAVSTSSYTEYAATWNPKAQLGEVYSSLARIKIVADDHENANNLGSAVSDSFILDTKAPIPGEPEGGGIGININRNELTSLSNDKTASESVNLYFSALEESEFQMAVSNTSDFVVEIWEDYSDTKSWTLPGGDGTKIVYVKYMDEYGNVSGPYSDTILLDKTPPVVPFEMFIQDISHIENATSTEEGATSTEETVDSSSYRLFVSWDKNTESDWASYKIYRSTNGVDFELYRTNLDRNVNYLVDTDLDESEEYYYKVVSGDDVSNYSDDSETIAMQPGTQPNDTAAPEISGIANTDPTASSVTITWDTDEVSDSTVLYSVDESYSETKGVVGYVTGHSVTLVGLDGGMEYNYKVQSCDPSDNCSVSDAASFSTAARDNESPLIDSIAVSNISTHMAVITWDTDEASTSFVEYSTTDGFGSGTLHGQHDPTTEHRVALPPVLDAGTEYYFRVHSEDFMGNEAISGQESFTTLADNPSDQTPPIISNIQSLDIGYNTAMITWATDEVSSSYVEFGLSASYGRVYGQYDLVTGHTVELPNDLTPGSDYHFRVRSVDASGNEAISEDQIFTTSGSIGDSTPPEISAVLIGEANSTSVMVTWTTNELATSFIDYSRDKTYSFEQGSAVMVDSHSATLIGLSPATQYYFRVKSMDPSGNLALDDNSGQGYTFATAAGPVPPLISGIQIVDVTHNSATINWTTNIDANSMVDYGFDPAGGTMAGRNDSTTTHSVTLTGLLSEVTYYFRARSTDQTEGVSEVLSFTTGTAPDLLAPAISNVLAGGITLVSAVITWSTNKNANSFVDYGTTASFGALAGNVEDAVTAHSVALSGLLPNKTYYYRVRSQDSSGNIATNDNGGNNYTFVTVADSTPPEISDVSTDLVADTSATITWTTNELATSQIEYGVSNKYGSQTEADITLTYRHAITIAGLTKETTYYYKVVSKDAADNSASDDNSGQGYFFTTTATPGEVIVITKSSSGGKQNPVDSGDKNPPVISGIEVKNITIDSATIAWTTNEAASSLVKYGLNTDYGILAGNPEGKQLTHTVVLSELLPKTIYHFQVVSYDAAGNVAISEDKNFTTASEGVLSEKGIIAAISARIKELANPASLSSIQQILEDAAAKMASAPQITGGSPKIEIGQSSAKITWMTDTRSNSIVAYVPEELYDQKKTDPYTMIAGKTDDLATTHEVQITGLEPSTVYHYQVRSKPAVGPSAVSDDGTFKTSGMMPEFYDISFDQVDSSQTNVLWKTNVLCSSVVSYTNFNTNEKKETTDAQFLLDHKIELKGLESSVNYSVVITAADEKGNNATSPILTISTGKDLAAPPISQVKTDNAISPRGDKVQAIISWVTEEPATSKIMYQEGAASVKDIEMKSVNEDKTMTLKHTMVLNLRPATVYFFRVQSQDLSGNISTSEDFTFLTPQQRRTVIQMIIENFGRTFSWMQK